MNPSRRGACWVGLLVLSLVGVAQGAPPVSDAARLNAAWSPEMARTVVWVLPPLDHRPILGEPGGVSPAFGDFLKALRSWNNLDVRMPDRAVGAVTGSAQHQQALPLARAAARRGLEDYRQVRLSSAIEALGQALETFLAIGQHWVAPSEVARTEQTRGLALLEKGDEVAAAAAFRRGLLVEPAVRLRAGVDRPAAVDAQEQARLALVDGLPAVQALFARRPALPGGAVIQVRILPDRLEVVLHEGGRLVVEQQVLGMPDAGERLAARLWACLPLADEPRRRSPTRKLHLDAGFAWFAFTKAPTEVFGNVGLAVGAALDLASHIALEARGSLTISSRDREEDLRADVPVGRLSLAPAFVADLGRLRTSASVGMEVALMGPVTTTTNPACKFFGPDEVPARICDFARDVDRRETAWTVGPALGLGASLRLVDEIELGLRLQAALYLLRTEDNGLDRPVGLQVVLGYPLF